MEELSMYVGKRIKIKADNEEEFIGKAIGFTQAIDNEPEIDEIDIRNESNNRLYGILKTEIKSIEVLEQKALEVKSMARDDYFVIVYKILVYLYECLKFGKNPDVCHILSKEAYGIEQSYFDYIMIHLTEDEYIEGVDILPIMGTERKTAKITSSIMIRPKGIEYLQENTMFAKIKSAIRELKDTIPDL